MTDTISLDGVRVLIADKDAQNGMKLQALLPPGVRCVGIATDYESAFRLIEQHQPIIVLMNINMALVMVNNKFSFPFLIIAVADEAKAEFLRLGIEIKARDLLIQPISSAILHESMSRTIRAHKREQSLVTEQAPAAPTSSVPGQVVAVIGCKGGLGQSTLITNLGLALTLQKKRTLLVDAVAQLGTQALLLDVPAIRTLDDVLGRSLSKEELQQGMLSHKSGLQLLAAPVNSDEIAVEDFALLLDTLRSTADIVLMDLPRFNSAFARSILAQSQHIYLMLSYNIPSIRNASLALGILNDLGVPKDHVHVIGTEFQSSSDLTRKDVTAHLKQDILCEIPQAHDALLTSINTGEAVLMTEPQHPYSVAVQKIANHLTGGSTATNATPATPSLQHKINTKGWF